jgi:hypothetical protein
VVLDSRNATEYYNGSWNSSVKFDFEEPIRLAKNYIAMMCSVFTFTCPNSIYNINETNSYLSLTVNGITTNYIITYGNYNANTFMTQLISQIGSSFSITFNTLNNIFTLSHTTYDFIINSTSTIYNVMGFKLNTNYNSVSRSLTMPFTCNFNGVQSINIFFENLNTKNIDSFNKSSSSIIQSIPVDSTSQQITFNKTADFFFKISQEEIDFIKIDIKDDLENNINFNNQHWNLSLYFTEIQDVDRFHYQNNFNSILNYGYQE